LQLLRQHHDAEWKLLPLHELREYERLQLGMVLSCHPEAGVFCPPKDLCNCMKREAQFVICVGNKVYAASLELRKIYQVIPDKIAPKLHQLRVIDESGEDYLYPEDYFVPVQLPRAVERAVRRATA